MKGWMKRLADHYEEMRGKFPEDKLMIIFDIDGTILDMRSMMLFTLQSYDRHHGCNFFKGLGIADIAVHETEIMEFLTDLPIPAGYFESIVNWYREKLWSRETIIEAHSPYSGVMEVIRWFQCQPATFISLNTGRSESIRNETLHSLNCIGRPFDVSFSGNLLYMNPGGWNGKVATSKVDGMRYFQNNGYRIFAFVDNEPDNLEAIATYDQDGDILLLHADTIFKSERGKIPKGAVSGSYYDLRPFFQRNFAFGKRQNPQSYGFSDHFGY